MASNYDFLNTGAIDARLKKRMTDFVEAIKCRDCIKVREEDKTFENVVCKKHEDSHIIQCLKCHQYYKDAYEFDSLAKMILPLLPTLSRSSVACGGINPASEANNDDEAELEADRASNMTSPFDNFFTALNIQVSRLPSFFDKFNTNIMEQYILKQIIMMFRTGRYSENEVHSMWFAGICHKSGKNLPPPQTPYEMIYKYIKTGSAFYRTSVCNNARCKQRVRKVIISQLVLPDVIQPCDAVLALTGKQEVKPCPICKTGHCSESELKVGNYKPWLLHFDVESNSSDCADLMKMPEEIQVDGLRFKASLITLHDESRNQFVGLINIGHAFWIYHDSRVKETVGLQKKAVASDWADKKTICVDYFAADH